MLEEVLEVAMNDSTFRSDDLEFTFAARVRASMLLPPFCNAEITDIKSC